VENRRLKYRKGSSGGFPRAQAQFMTARSIHVRKNNSCAAGAIHDEVNSRPQDNSCAAGAIHPDLSS